MGKVIDITKKLEEKNENKKMFIPLIDTIPPERLHETFKRIKKAKDNFSKRLEELKNS